MGVGCAKKKISAKPAPSPEPEVARTQTPAPPAARQTSTPPPAQSPQPQRTAPQSPLPAFSDLIASRLQDIHFDYDQSVIRETDGSILARDAATLKQIFHDFPVGKVLVEGDCDDRGSAEYNLALGDKRARATREYLTHLGLPDSRLDVISYGKENPVCTEDNSVCWQKNRRAHFRAE